MFERFTERARQVVILGQDEARAMKHRYIGTEHLLLGLLRIEDGLAALVLSELRVDVENVRERVRAIVGDGDVAIQGQIPFTPRSKKTLELALREALSIGHNYIGTEHLLLALTRESEGVAARILHDLEIEAETVRSKVIKALTPPGRAGRATKAPGYNPSLLDIVRTGKDMALDQGRFAIASRLREIENELRK